VRRVKAFLRFWYDFVVGDDWSVAAGLVVALGLTALLKETGTPAWWLPPIAVLLLLANSLRRAA
jgi:hypothetical protein